MNPDKPRAAIQAEEGGKRTQKVEEQRKEFLNCPHCHASI